ncbi:hypothetical protein [Hymenobacter sublimis]|uniref:Uncharacterized protein n=1 Tax=Hymenobacter sublimis TaxID=2933777 RepID=A0ABY4J8I7_9BACT|nr:hypothetical protein [Hymenobacter sublimis]UPL48252.1 hypothetical protein MWH26_13770 [Hymenobacter sublimis]
MLLPATTLAQGAPSSSAPELVPTSRAEVHLLTYIHDYVAYSRKLFTTTTDTAAIRIARRMVAEMSPRRDSVAVELYGWLIALSEKQRQQAQRRLTASKVWADMNSMPRSPEFKRFYRRVEENAQLAEAVTQLEQAELTKLKQ